MTQQQIEQVKKMRGTVPQWVAAILIAVCAFFMKELYSDIKDLKTDISGKDGLRERVTRVETKLGMSR